MKQTRSVTEYQSQFEAISTKVTGLSKPWIVSFFIARLIDYLECQLRLAKPSSYPEVVALARLHEQNHLALQQSLKAPMVSVGTGLRNRFSASSSFPGTKTSINPVPKLPELASNPGLTPSPTPVTNTSPKPAFKRFTVAELRERRRQGLCYYYNEKYNPSHNCRPQYLALLAPEDLDEMYSNVDLVNDSEEDKVVLPEVSFNALSGEYHPSTLRLTGYYKDSKVNVLVDSGSTFNFVKPSVAQGLSMPQTSIEPFKVFVGSGDFIWCRSISKDIMIGVQANSFFFCGSLSS